MTCSPFGRDQIYTKVDVPFGYSARVNASLVTSITFYLPMKYTICLSGFLRLACTFEEIRVAFHRKSRQDQLATTCESVWLGEIDHIGIRYWTGSRLQWRLILGEYH